MLVCQLSYETTKVLALLIHNTKAVGSNCEMYHIENIYMESWWLNICKKPYTCNEYKTHRAMRKTSKVCKFHVCNICMFSKNFDHACTHRCV